MRAQLHQDLEFSRIVAGVMNWGVWGANHSSDSVAELIEQCLDIGVTSFDHADIYGNYTTELLFGEAFKKASISRSKIQIITKCGIKMPCNERPQYTQKSYSNTRTHILESVDRSLQNLNTDYIDLLLIHRPSPLLDPYEVADTFTYLRSSGKVRHFGVSNFLPPKFDLLHKQFPLVTNQIEASMIHLDPFEDGTVDSAMSHQVRPMAWAPLGGGQLFAKSKDYDVVMRRGRFLEVAKKYGWSLDEMAYKFLLHHPSGIIPVTGSSKIERIKVAVNALDKDITEDQWFEIWTASTGNDVP